MIAILGFLTIGLFLVLTMTKRVSVLTALVLVPVITALVGGFAADIGADGPQGLGKVAPTGIMIAFAVLYFSLMIDTGLFDPLIRGILRLAKDDPLRIAVGTAVLTMCVALDGDGASTFLITVSALLPIYKRLNMSPLVLTGVVCLGAGVMNMVPWGGPTARAMAVLQAGQLRGVHPGAARDGRGHRLGAGRLVPDRPRERRRLGTVTLPAQPEPRAPSPGHRAPGRAGRGDGPGTPLAPEPGAALTVFNLVLTLVLLVELVLQVMPLPVLFVHRVRDRAAGQPPTWEDQQALLDKHGRSVVLVTTMIFAAGVFTGILNGTKMITEMATAFVGIIPESSAATCRCSWRSPACRSAWSSPPTPTTSACCRCWHRPPAASASTRPRSPVRPSSAR